MPTRSSRLVRRARQRSPGGTASPAKWVHVDTNEQGPQDETDCCLGSVLDVTVRHAGYQIYDIERIRADAAQLIADPTAQLDTQDGAGLADVCTRSFD